MARVPNGVAYVLSGLSADGIRRLGRGQPQGDLFVSNDLADLTGSTQVERYEWAARRLTGLEHDEMLLLGGYVIRDAQTNGIIYEARPLTSAA